MTHTGIKKPDGKSELRFENGRTVDIQAVIFEVNKDKIWQDTADFSRQYRPTREDLRKLWQFVKSNIRYQEDPDGFQYIRYPSRLVADGVGDCKSFTLFIVSVLQNLGVPYTIRFTRYGKGPVTHVYPVAHLPEGDVIIDAVWTQFDSEKKYYGKAENFKFEKKMSQIVKLSGIGSATTARMFSVTDNLPMPTPGRDITEMTDAEFYQFLGFRAVGKTTFAYETRMAFAPPILTLPDESVMGALFKKKPIAPPSPQGGAKRPSGAPLGQGKSRGSGILKKVVTKAGDAAKNIGVETKKVAIKVKEAWSKLINWVFGTALQKAAPFFLFTYLKKDVSPRIAALKAKQNGILNWLCRASGVDRAKVDATIRAGIVKNLGKQPEQVLNAAARSTVAGIGFTIELAVEAFQMLVDLIGKIAAFFKGKKNKEATPTADQNAGSSLDILTTDSQATGETKPAGNDNPKGTVIVPPVPTVPSGDNAPTTPSVPTPESGTDSSNTDESGTDSSDTDSSPTTSQPNGQPIPGDKLKRKTPKAAADSGLSTGTMLLGGIVLVGIAVKVLGA